MEGLILAIVIGLISALFGRNKEKGKDQTNRPRTPTRAAILPGHLKSNKQRQE
ncbi:hypothetical protein ACPJHQ_17010 [Rossellomorea sp. H39__3]